MISILIFLCRQTANVYVDVVYRLIGGALRHPTRCRRALREGQRAVLTEIAGRNRFLPLKQGQFCADFL